MGRLDVDAMLDEIDPKTFLEWQIAASMGLDRDGWLMVGELAASITNQIKSVAHGRDAEFRTASAFLPEGIEG